MPISHNETGVPWHSGSDSEIRKRASHALLGVLKKKEGGEINDPEKHFTRKELTLVRSVEGLCYEHATSREEFVDPSKFFILLHRVLSTKSRKNAKTRKARKRKLPPMDFSVVTPSPSQSNPVCIKQETHRNSYNTIENGDTSNFNNTAMKKSKSIAFSLQSLQSTRGSRHAMAPQMPVAQLHHLVNYLTAPAAAASSNIPGSLTNNSNDPTPGIPLNPYRVLANNNEQQKQMQRQLYDRYYNMCQLRRQQNVSDQSQQGQLGAAASQRIGEKQNSASNNQTVYPHRSMTPQSMLHALEKRRQEKLQTGENEAWEEILNTL